MHLQRDALFLNKNHVVELQKGNIVIPLVEIANYHVEKAVITDTLGMLRNIQLWKFILPDGSIAEFFLSDFPVRESLTTALSAYFRPR